MGGGAAGGRLRKVILGLVVLTVAAPVLVAPPAAAEGPIFVAWSDYLPSLTAGHDPSDANDCKAGRAKCVDSVIREMTRRFDRQAAVCDHDAVFALTYLRTTEEYRRTIEDPTFFEDTAFVNHEDAVFARYYFEATDGWEKGTRSAVPEAWRIAFSAADARSVSGTGNIFLGLSAHINRDLPYVLAEIGLVKPDGTSRKADHDRVNQFLNRVTEPVLAEAAARFDPTIDDRNAPGTYDEAAALQLVVAWREEAWRNAERLVAASTSSERSVVVSSIESSAAAKARSLLLTTTYGLGQSSAARDAHCSAHRTS